MGVLQLWNILEPVKRTGDLSLLNGKNLCVDLSVWICEAHGAKGLKSNVLKPHLRNLFFRVWNLIRAGVKLVFVVDGDPPKVKWEAILKRTQARNGFGAGRGKEARGPPRKKVGRSNFRVRVNECIALLKLLGVPYLESAGEAEALCAWLNAKGFVDGCITNDGDVFLYGGQTVYKDLCISTKDCSMDCYNMHDIEAQLGLSRKSLISLAILLGCDYLPQGVPGIGKEIGLKLIHELNGVNILERFNQWSTFQITDSDMSKIERSVKKKALKIPGFPNREVISEFLSPKLKTQQLTIPQGYNCPDLKGTKDFCLKYLEWPEDYTTEKVLSLVTYWQMNRPLEDSSNIIIPERIVKPRVQNRVECYEILWRNEKIGDACQSTFSTIENKQMFDKIYPDIAQNFAVAQHEKKSKKQGKRKGKKIIEEVCADEENLGNLCENLNTLSLQLPLEATQALSTNREMDSSCHKEAYNNNTLNDRENQDADVDVHVLPDEAADNLSTVSSDFFEIPLPLSVRIAKKKSLLQKVGKCSVDTKRCHEINEDKFVVIEEACITSSDLFVIPQPLSAKPQGKSVSDDNARCQADRKRCNGIDLNKSNTVNDKVHSVSDSWEVHLPLSERITKMDSTLEKISEKVDKYKASEKENSMIHGIANCARKPMCSGSGDSRAFPIKSEEKNTSQTKCTGQLNEFNSVDGKMNEEIHGMAEVYKSLGNLSGHSRDLPKRSEERKASQNLCKARNKSSNAKRKPKVLHSVEFSSSDDDNDSWLVDSVNESGNMLSSASKLHSDKVTTKQRREEISLAVKIKCKASHGKESQRVDKSGVEGSSGGFMHYNLPHKTRRGVFSSCVDANLVTKTKETRKFDGNSNNPEESSILLLTPEISRIEDNLLSTKAYNYDIKNKPVCKPDKQELQVEEAKVEIFLDDFDDESEVVLITPEKPVINYQNLPEDTKPWNSNNETKQKSFENDNKELKEKKNQVDSPLFVPLPLSERIRILRQTQFNPLNTQKNLSTHKN